MKAVLPIREYVARLRVKAHEKATKGRDEDSQWRLGGACALLEEADELEREAAILELKEGGPKA